MNYTILFLIVIVLILVYVLYTYFTKTSMTSGLISLSAETTIDIEKLDKPNVANYYYEGWVFVQSTVGSPKRLFGRADDVQIILNDNTLIIYKDNSTSLFDVTTNFPLQKWVHIAVNVVAHNNSSSTIEVYINGKLVTTKTNMGLSDLPKGIFVIGSSGGNPGYCTKIIRKPFNTNPEDVWNSYVKGNGIGGVVSLLSSYNVNVMVSKDDVLQKKIALI